MCFALVEYADSEFPAKFVFGFGDDLDVGFHGGSLMGCWVWF